jgi:uncharacterized membrane protein YdcZ (DUF606 family)
MVGAAGKRRFSLEKEDVATSAYLLFAFVAGAMLAFQFGINAQLADWIDSTAGMGLVAAGVALVRVF